MAQLASIPRGAAFRPDILIVIALTGVIGFSLGQHWPEAASTGVEAGQALTEDWHGNVRRSHWPN